MTTHTTESDEKPPERYRRLILELEVARRQAGGELSQAEEARRADELDQLWWSMSDAEQTEYERAMGRAVAKAWRKGVVVRLPPRPRLPPSLPRSWLVRSQMLPNWIVLLAWLVHVGLMFWLGRMTAGW